MPSLSSDGGGRFDRKNPVLAGAKGGVSSLRERAGLCRNH